MTREAEAKRSTARSFGQAASAYRDSTVHREGSDLETIAYWCEDADCALDIGTGAGHTALALLGAGVDTVTAVDASHRMIETTLEADSRIRGIVGDAECLPLATSSHTAVTCRLAAHHFPSPERFLEEVARVLEPGGVFVFEDTVGPADPEVRAFLEHLETVRDPTHVASNPVARWREWIRDLQMRIEECQRFAKRIPFDEWMAAQSVPTDRREEIETALQSATPAAVNALGIERSGESIEAISLPKVLLRARRE